MDEAADPIVNALNRPFWEAAERGVLRLPVCGATMRAFWPPSPLSPFDVGAQVVWKECPPTGVLLSRIVFRRLFHEPFSVHLPYAAGLTQLDTGPRLQGFIARPDDPSAPRPGDRVRLEFQVLTPGGRHVPVLVVAPGEQP
jgi:uncharacterized OB-fold protein